VKRRRFIQLLGGAAAAAPVATRAQQPVAMPRIAFLSTSSPPGSTFVEAFVGALRERGYVEGRSIAIEWRWGRGSTEHFAEFAAEIVAMNVDVIVAANTLAGVAARRATETIPVVVAAMDDSVRSGLVASLARPCGNVTGLSLLTQDLEGKRLELLKEALPGVTHVALLIDAGGGPQAPLIDVKSIEAAAQALGIRLGPVLPIGSADEIAGALARIAKEGSADATLAAGGTTLFANRAALAEQAVRYAVPLMCDVRDAAEAGCLMSYGAHLPALFQRAAVLVDKILKGAKPAELPVEQPTRFELVINLRTAKALGLSIPPAIIARADQVIE
jgi:putative ABC transport system substrate-binding protein